MEELRRIARARAKACGVKLYAKDMKSVKQVNADDINIKGAYMRSKRLFIETYAGERYIIESVPDALKSGRYMHTIRKEEA